MINELDYDMTDEQMKKLLEYSKNSGGWFIVGLVFGLGFWIANWAVYEVLFR